MQQTTIKHQTMPSFFKHSNGNGIRKPRFTPHKHVLHAIPSSTTSLFNTSLFNTSLFNTSLFNTSFFTSVFDSQDCIWYYGTLYVKEATAVAKLQELNQSNKDQSNKENQDLIQENGNGNQDHQYQYIIQENDDDDIESVSSSSKRNVGKQNQLARLKDGMRLRHLIPLNNSSGSGSSSSSSGNSNNDEWFAMFDAESNRIIRTPDGVAFDTLRQFARLHCNEVWGTTTVLTNVWSDPYFQYQDIDDDAWHPLSNLKK
jgi:hypothetical protein